jgi:pimeloyl-ACP methyl ester carboxylesterase
MESRCLTVPETVEHLEKVVGELDQPPIIMGHSFGGVLTQILLDHGFGAAGVAIDSVPAEGIKVVPPSQIRASFPVLKNPANRHRAVPFTPKQFHYAFTNTLSEEKSQKVYDRYHIPAPGSWVWGGVLANFTPGHQATYVDFKNGGRAPLLFIAGGEDNLMPPFGERVQRTTLPQFEGDHRLQGVRRPVPLHAWTGRLGGSCRLRSQLG